MNARTRGDASDPRADAPVKPCSGGVQPPELRREGVTLDGCVIIGAGSMFTDKEGIHA